MAWSPNPTVTVSGTDYTATALLGATITYGRTNTYNQPRAGYCAVSLADTNNSATSFNVGDPVAIAADNYTGTPVTLFTGTITDVVTTVVNSSPIGSYLRRDVIAVGPLGLLSRRLAGADGYTAQNDGDRIESILTAIYWQRWNTTPATQTWAATNSTYTWANYNYNTSPVGEIDTPGLFELSPYTNGETNAYTLATTVANNGLGVLYDTPEGRINYDDADHRGSNALSNGFWTIPAEAIYSAGLTQSVRLGDVANTINLTYTGGTVTVTNTDSENLYGPVSKQIQTTLANLTDATEQANRYLGLVDTPQPQFDTLSLAVHQPNLTSSTINTALAVYNGQPITVNDLPEALGPSFTGFVEGWTWRLGQKTADLKLTVSDYGTSVVTSRWQGVTPTKKWNTVTPASLTWAEAIEV